MECDHSSILRLCAIMYNYVQLCTIMYNIPTFVSKVGPPVHHIDRMSVMDKDRNGSCRIYIAEIFSFLCLPSSITWHHMMNLPVLQTSFSEAGPHLLAARGQHVVVQFNLLMVRQGYVTGLTFLVLG